MKRKFLQILSVLLIVSLLLMGCSQRNIQDSEPSTSDNTQEENTQTEQTEQTNETTANAASKDSLRVCDTPLFSFELPEDAYYKGFREEDDFNGTGYHSVSEDFYNEYAEYMRNYYKVEDFEDDNATKNDQILRDKEHLWFDIYHGKYIYDAVNELSDPYEIAKASYKSYLETGYAPDTEVRWSEIIIDGVTAYRIEVYPDLSYPSEKFGGMPGESTDHIYFTGPQGEPFGMTIHYLDESDYEATQYLLDHFHFK